MTASGHRIFILVADDDADDRFLIQDAFKENGIDHDLRFVEDGEQLMAYLRREGEYSHLASSPYPSLVLLDLNMPKKDGREALAEIKNDPNLYRIPVVILTTSNAEEDILRSYGLGASSFITKPVVFNDLLILTKTLTQYWIDLVELPPQCISKID
jgi:two-component system, response regulator